MDIKNKIEMAIRCLMAHPDNKPNSEFADRIDDLIEVNQAITVTQCCKSDSEQFVCKQCEHNKTAVNTVLEKICCAKCRSFAN